VKGIAQLPDSGSRYLNPNLKLYETIIELSATEATLRNGMSCQAKIMIEHYDDALFIKLLAAEQTATVELDACGLLVDRRVPPAGASGALTSPEQPPCAAPSRAA
jgi:hypothetical protein